MKLYASILGIWSLISPTFGQINYSNSSTAIVNCTIGENGGDKECLLITSGLDIDSGDSEIEFEFTEGPKITCRNNGAEGGGFDGNCYYSRDGDGGGGDDEVMVGSATIIEYGQNLDGVPNIFGSLVDTVADEVCQISPNASGQTLVKCRKSSEFAPEADAIYHDETDRLLDESIPEKVLLSSSSKLRQNNKAASPEVSTSQNHRQLYDDLGGNIDVLVVWTKEAECKNSGESVGCELTPATTVNMMGRITLAITETNEAYNASLINTQLRLVHAYRDEDYEEENNSPFNAALNALSSKTDGKMDDVHIKREYYGADVVAMIIGSDQYCGLAYIGPGKNLMFSVTKYSCATGYYSFGHEIGHNLGCNHDRGTSNECSSSNSNYGYRDPQARFRSVLGYNCNSNGCDNTQDGGCTRVKMFSNPNTKWDGYAIGDSMNDNARQINEVREEVAGYMPVITGPPTTMPPTFSPSTSPTKLPCLDGESTLKIDITFDNYEDETTWVVRSECTNSQEIILNGGPYNNTVPVHDEQCITDGQFTFTIFDSYSDGICCAFGNGSYTVTHNEVVVASGGVFGQSESITFGNCTLNSPTSTPTSLPPPSHLNNLSDVPSTMPSSVTSQPPSSTLSDTPSLTSSELPSNLPSIILSDTPSMAPACPEGESPLQIYINFDNYQDETAWSVRNECTNSQEIIHSGDNYERGQIPSVTEELCITDGQFTFNISDSYGDGICCSFGDGGYTVTYNEVVVASGSDFGKSESVTFGNCTLTLPPTPSTSLPPPSHLNNLSNVPSTIQLSVPSQSPSITMPDNPSSMPSALPSSLPSIMLSDNPSKIPSSVPSQLPSMTMSNNPSSMPSELPSSSPSIMLSDNPSKIPSLVPSQPPSITLSNIPSRTSSELPSSLPSIMLSAIPSTAPSTAPTIFSCPEGESTLKIDIILDTYPSETTWSVRNECTNSQEIIHSGDNYTGQIPSVTEELCITDGQFTFTISDSYGDGICCGFGDGGYNVTHNEVVVASGGDFGPSDSITFGDCTPSELPSNLPSIILSDTPSMAPACPEGESPLQIYINFDNYQDETAWSVRNECTNSQEIIHSGENYERGQIPSVTEELCITDGQFTFNISDSYGDGICCSFGDGGYTVTYNEVVVASGSDFGKSESVTFGECITSSSITFEDAERWVVCGNYLNINNCPVASKKVSELEKHKVRCCSDTKVDIINWKNYARCDGVWGGSYLSCSENTSGCCSGEQTFQDATDLCENMNARLCTRAELENSCAKGSGCSYDRELLWSSDEI